MNRVPVVSKEGKPLMPTKPSRARRWVKEGKAVGRWSDLGVYYVQLTELPSAEEVQPIAVGVDPGKSYSGIGVQSAKCTLLQLHLILPFGRVKKRMETRAMLRRSRRGRRINRNVPFNTSAPLGVDPERSRRVKQRNHRQCSFDNRKQCKLPPSIKASRQLELRTVKELAAIFPVAAIGYERVKADIDQTKRKRAKSGKGFSPVMTGQNWAISQMEKIAPVYVRHGWQKDGNGTSQLRTQLGLEKDKVNKSIAKPETHAVDGVTLACGYFINVSRESPPSALAGWGGIA
ncbi:MAG: RRXRR domain-containing protein, partial [Coleofasciculus sp.]|uniref:RRXRR domain-containing protein n=2 Tax=Coleofasciculus sp. TaxID=3100458 RepID=UPI003A1F06A7